MSTTKKKPKYPESEKLLAIASQSQKIGEFLDWLSQEKEIVFARWVDDEESEQLAPVSLQAKQLLAEFFEINMAMLKNLLQKKR